MAQGFDDGKVREAMSGSSLKNAYFWRLMARSLEEKKGTTASVGQACASWEEFRKHAIREGWIPANGPEVAAIYLHMADQIRHLDPDELAGTPALLSARRIPIR